MAKPAAHPYSTNFRKAFSNLHCKPKHLARLRFHMLLLGLLTCAVMFICIARDTEDVFWPGRGRVQGGATPAPADVAVDRLVLVPAVRGQRDVFLFSAFYDARPLIFLAAPRVTVIALASDNFLDGVDIDDSAHKMECVFDSPGQGWPSVWRISAQVVRFGEWHHFKKFRPCYIHCNLDTVFATWMAGNGGIHIPERISVSIADDIQNEVARVSIVVNHMFGAPFPPQHPVTTPCRKNPQKDCDTIGICVSPIYGEAYHSTLEHYIEHYHNLAEGNVEFIIYNASAGPLTSAALARSREQRNINVVQFIVENEAFPETDGMLGNIHQRGQSEQVNDCMMRFAGRARWVGYIDLDEYIVPRCSEATSFRDMFSLSSVFNTNHWANESAIPSYPSSFMFLHTFFYEDSKAKKHGTGAKSLSPSQRAMHRIPGFFPPGRRTKVFSNPIATLEQGIHYVEVFASQCAWKASEETTVAMRHLWDARHERIGYFEYLASIRSKMVYREAVVSPHVAANHHIRHDLETGELVTTAGACDSGVCVIDMLGSSSDLGACSQAAASDLQLIQDDEPPNYPNKYHYYQYMPRGRKD